MLDPALKAAFDELSGRFDRLRDDDYPFYESASPFGGTDDVSMAIESVKNATKGLDRLIERRGDQRQQHSDEAERVRSRTLPVSA
jgi:hypothetical protein